MDGLELDRFEPGRLYDVGTSLGSLMLSEGWAEPVATETAAPAPLEPKAEPRSSESTRHDDIHGRRIDERSEAEHRGRSTPSSDIDIAADYRRRRDPEPR